MVTFYLLETMVTLVFTFLTTLSRLIFHPSFISSYLHKCKLHKHAHTYTGKDRTDEATATDLDVPAQGSDEQGGHYQDTDWSRGEEHGWLHR